MKVNAVSIFDSADYDQQIADAAARLQDGKIVVVPTETVYGAAGLLSNPESADRLRNLRSRSTEPSADRKAFTVHIARPEQALNYLGTVGELGRRMMQKAWPGPVALQFEVSADRRAQIAKNTGADAADLFDGNTITLRCPKHLVASDVLALVDGPVAMTVVEPKISTDGIAEFEQPMIDGKEAGPILDLALEAGAPQFAKPSTIVRIREKDPEIAGGKKESSWQIVRAGIYDQRIIERLLRTTILFVCSGNTCRSPMAEALARNILADQLSVSEMELESRGYQVISAGCYAMPGARATTAAVEAVKTLGADLSRHRSRTLTVELIHEADQIFTMGAAHRKSVIGLVPAAAQKTSTLDPAAEIEDPIGGDLALYQELAGAMKELIARRLKETITSNV